MRAAGNWTAREVSGALGTAPASGDRSFSGICTDSRAVERGDLFVALVGERFDGHDFLDQVLAAGASGIVVDRPVPESGAAQIFRVADTLTALGNLAAHHRRRLDLPVVGITGSSGKTTTKEFTRAALEADRTVHATEANYNNRIGLPITVLTAPEDTGTLVLEMGTNEPGEIAELARIAAPDVGVVTTVGESHLEGLGSVEGVMREKLALLRALPSDGVGLVGDLPPELPREASLLLDDVRVAGMTEQADPDLRAGPITVHQDGSSSFTWRGHAVRVHVPGGAAVVDALLALGVADVLGVEASRAIEGLGAYRPSGMRSEIRDLGTLTLVVDCYNANPQSIRVAADLLRDLPRTGERVLVLGSMRELGPQSHALHVRVLEDLADYGFDRFYLSGAFAAAVPEVAALSSRTVAIPDVQDLAPRLIADLEGTEVVLLKASRGERLERLIPAFEEHFGAGGEA